MSPIKKRKGVFQSNRSLLDPSPPDYTHFQRPDHSLTDYLRDISIDQLAVIRDLDVIRDYAPLAEAVDNEYSRRTSANLETNEEASRAPSAQPQTPSVRNNRSQTATSNRAEIESTGGVVRRLTTFILIAAAMVLLYLILG